jgi:hypothetical protein
MIDRPDALAELNAEFARPRAASSASVEAGRGSAPAARS